MEVIVKASESAKRLDRPGLSRRSSLRLMLLNANRRSYLKLPE
jgi:hypothetical protein